MTRIAILISGRGSNMQALVAACDAGQLDIDIVQVISSRADAAGIAWAADHGLPVDSHLPRDFVDREAHDRALLQKLVAVRPDWVLLCGYMRILGETFVRHFEGRLINIHPSLLPAYPGLDTHRRALAEGALLHGATVHFVVPALDAGPPIAQAVVPVLPDDDEPRLAARVLEMEHRLYPLALQRVLASGQTGRGPSLRTAVLMHPLLATGSAEANPASRGAA